jgi:hypothetical protein
MIHTGTRFDFKIYYVAFFSGDTSANVNVTQDKLTAQMQEKGRRLAQELPGFNWLEEKILNGGVSTVLPPKRVSGASVVDPVNKSILVSERANGVSDAANSSGLPTASSPPVQRLVACVHK